uniref:Post-GPI attachment to proteins factor 3 n=3 Tax=Schistocephalus solidus TaxID=70667 RepID=A0A0X3PA20_SCHSO
MSGKGNRMDNAYYALLALLAYLVPWTDASVGDQSYVYQQCISACLSTECNVAVPNATASGVYRPPALALYERAVVWNCEDECKYCCTWWAVEAFHKDGLPVPQFYGKWPQVRIFGIQEPASALFSLLNLFAQWHTLNSFCEETSFRAPMSFTWVFFSLVGINAWFWSTVFHTYDTNFTERMDYLSAFGYVVALLFVLTMRILYKQSTLIKVVAASFVFTGFVSHAYRLLFTRFGYAENIQINAFVGSMTIFGWLLLPRLAFDRLQQVYARYIQLAVTLIGCASALEIFDFPAIFWLFDAHSLWHGSTIGIHYLIVKFAIRDCKYISSRQLALPKTRIL